ncbi:MAG: hypothetical protein ISR65_03470 [Bacteriovoracaceae bacterium]|nr:hypothetical protein [Bacteriovoracaceae bacterium]
MKFIVLSALLLSVFSVGPAFAFDTKVKGFVAIDLLSTNKKESQDQKYEFGIGVLDLKLYAQHEKFNAKIKLDLDDGKMDEKYNIFEEMTVSYRFNDKFKIKVGKGKVPFHRLHWGAIENCYTDGGSMLGTEQGWRDQDNLVLTTFTYGGYHHGLINHFSIFGTSRKYSIASNGYFENDPSKTVQLNDQRGLANKFIYFPFGGLELSASIIFHKNDYNPQSNWAADFGGGYEQGNFEIWFEYVFGFISHHKYYSSYSKKKLRQYEQTLQLGGEYKLSSKISAILNTEVVFINQTTHDDGYWQRDNYKLDFGAKYNFNRNTFATLGALVEKRIQKGPSSKDELAGYKAKASLSHWF